MPYVLSAPLCWVSVRESCILATMQQTQKLEKTETLSPSTWKSKNMSLKSSESHSVVSISLQPHGLYSPWKTPGQNPAVGSHSLFQGIFPTQGLKPGLPHCGQILKYLSHQGRWPHNYHLALHILLTLYILNELAPLALWTLFNSNNTPCPVIYFARYKDNNSSIFMFSIT